MVDQSARGADHAETVVAALGELLDALAVLSADLSCECELPDRLILPAARVRETCAAIDDTVPVLKALLMSIRQRSAMGWPVAQAGEEPHPG